MKDKKLWTTMGVVLAVFFLFFLFLRNPTVETKQKIESASSETRTSQGEVTIDLTPVKFENGKMFFQIEFDTHTIDLSKYKLVELTLLQHDGKEARPVSAPELSGHHNSGMLVFDTGQELKNFKIIITGIPDVNERILEW